MKYNVVFIVFLLTVFYACEKRSTVDSFDVVEKVVVYDSIYSDINEPFNSIVDMEIVDSVLITKHARDEYYFSFIDVKTGKMIRRWGKTGRGPGEYIRVGSGLTVSKSRLVFADGERKELNYISIADILKGDTFPIIKEIYPYIKDFRPRHLTVLNDKKIAIGAFKEGHFGILDAQNNIRNHTFDYPFVCEDLFGIDRGSVLQTKIKSNDSQNRFVVLTLASDIFEIYQMQEEVVERIFVTSFQHVPVVRKRDGRYGLRTQESMAGLIRMAVSDDYICFGYSSDTYEKAMKAGLASNEILCFNWNGEKVKKYVLPFAVKTFCVDKQYIYAVGYSDDQSKIYRFQL